MKSACIVFGADELDELDIGRPALSTLNAQGPVETNPLHSALGYVPPEEFKQAAYWIRNQAGSG